MFIVPRYIIFMEPDKKHCVNNLSKPDLSPDNGNNRYGVIVCQTMRYKNTNIAYMYRTMGTGQLNKRKIFASNMEAKHSQKRNRLIVVGVLQVVDLTGFNAYSGDNAFKVTTLPSNICTDQRSIPHPQRTVSYAELWCFLPYQHEHAVEQNVVCRWFQTPKRVSDITVLLRAMYKLMEPVMMHEFWRAQTN